MRLIFIGILFIVFSNLRADYSDYKFRKISPAGGFTYEGIRHITQDNRGVIWFATYFDVFSYNGKITKQILVENTDSVNPNHEQYNGIVTDNNGNIWLATRGGLKLFDATNQRFNAYNYNNKMPHSGWPNISDIKVDKKGNVWIIDENGVGILDTLNRKTKTITNIPDDFKPVNIYFENELNAFISNKNGDLYSLNLKNKSIKFFKKSAGSRITSLLVDNQQIYVTYRNHGLKLIDKQGNQIHHFTYRSNSGESLLKNNLRDLYKDKNGFVWLASYHGIFILKNKRVLRFIQVDESGLPHRSIYSFFEGRNGSVWIGSWNGGLAYLNHSDNHFEYFGHTKGSNSLTNNVVSCFTNYDDKIYIGTEIGGLNLFDPNTNHFTPITIKRGKNKVTNIKCITKDIDNTLWIGTFRNGLWYKKKNQSIFRNYTWEGDKNLRYLSYSTHSLSPTDSGLWIGSDRAGISFYSFKSKELRPLSEIFQEVGKVSDFTACKILVNDSSFWIVCHEGLIQIKVRDGKILTHRNSHPGITNLMYFNYFEAQDGKIWFGSKSNGAICYNPQIQQFEKIELNEILNGADVYGFEEDNYKNLWLTTNVGLVVYNYEYKTVRQFLEIDGIQGNIFNPQASFKDSKGFMYFGGTNGFTRINPNKLKRNITPPNTILNSITINNDRKIYQLEPYLQNTGIHLNPNESSLRFDFSSDNYLLSKKNKYKYRLLPLDNNWIDTDWSGLAVYTNLPGGKYTFEVMAANNDGIWNTVPQQINIQIDKPWYKTNIAFYLYFLIIICIVLLVLYVINERLKLKKAVSLEKIKREHEEIMHQVKMRFFTNISHELRTPLTLIASPVKKLLRSNSLKQNEKHTLNLISNNTNRLLALINQTLDIRKIEMKPEKLALSKFDLVSFTRNRLYNFEGLQQDNSLNVEFISSQAVIEIEADEDKMDKVIFNLLSNSFKYTPEAGNIRIVISEEDSQNKHEISSSLQYGLITSDKFVCIEISNSCIPIEREKWEKIFERYETTSKNKKVSTGIGLSVCKDYTLLHSGKIWAQQSENMFTISLCLPVLQKSTLDIEEVRVVGSNSPDLVDGIPMRTYLKELDNHKANILVVEDNFELRNYIVQFLKETYTVNEAENGKEALEIVNESKIDLIISDVMMPVMNGFEFCQQIKSNLHLSHIPVILLTALSSTDKEITGFDVGADAYVSKPFDENLLLSRVQNLLKQRRTLREAFNKHIKEDEPFNAGGIDNYFLNKLNGVIEKHMKDEEFSVKLVSSELGMSRSQLFRKISQLTPYNPTEYIKVFKLKKSKELILQDKYPMDEIAYLTGFSSNSYFTKSFKGFFGMTPTQWKKSKLG